MHHGFGYGFGPRWGHGFGAHAQPGFRRHGRARGHVMYELLRRLDATPAQEKALLALADALVQQALDARKELRDTRRELARSLGSEVLDQVALEAAFARGGELVARMSRELKHALAEAHEVLDGEQRQQLAEWLRDGAFSPESYGW